MKGKGKPQLRLLNENVALPSDLRLEDIRYVGERILKDKGERSVINVIFVGDNFIRDLNLRHRGRDSPTDVLSFRLNTIPGEEEEVSGEVYISVDRAIDQAGEFDTTPAEEITVLFVHGLLHLFGYEDETPEGAEDMKAESSKYLKEFPKR